MVKNIFRVALNMMFCAIIFFVGLLIVSRLITGLYSKNRISKYQEAPNMPVGIVFGAGLRRDGSPTAILRDRVETAAKLYLSGRVEKLLLSGDNRVVEYNEPLAMKTYAIELGIPEDDLVLDYAGRRTYDTCYRAKEIFKVNDALLITQDFHMPRAVFTCNMLGINAQGVVAANRTYRLASMIYWNLREVMASFVAIWDLWIGRPVPVLGEPEPIFTTSIKKSD